MAPPSPPLQRCVLPVRRWRGVSHMRGWCGHPRHGLITVAPLRADRDAALKRGDYVTPVWAGPNTPMLDEPAAPPADAGLIQEAIEALKKGQVQIARYYDRNVPPPGALIGDLSGLVDATLATLRKAQNG